jgi:hypothetical protein
MMTTDALVDDRPCLAFKVKFANPAVEGDGNVA